MATYSTAQVAEMLGIGTDTLHRWLKERKVVAPELRMVGGVKVRLWTEAEVNAARKYKANHYWGKGSQRNRKSRKKRAK